MKIALWNASGLPNFGDALLDTTNRIELGLRIPSASFETFCPWAMTRSTTPLFIDAEGHWEGEGKFSAIVIGGGALLIGPPFNHPGLQAFYLGARPDRFRDRCFIAWNAICCDRQSVTGLSAHRQFVQDAAGRMSTITTRNQRTSAFLHEWGVSEPIADATDPALLCGDCIDIPDYAADVGVVLARPTFTREFIEYMRRTALEYLQRDSQGFIQLSSSHAFLGEQDHLKSLRHLLNYLAESFELRFAAFNNMYDDVTYACNVIGRPTGDRLNDLDSYVRWMRQVRCVVAFRLHHCIMAVACGMPIVALDSANTSNVRTTKLREFMAQAELLELYSSADPAMLSPERVRELIEKALRSREQVLRARARLRQLAAHHFDTLASAIRAFG